MSIEDEISKIEKQKLASDMPEEFNGTIIRLHRDVKKGLYAGTPLLKVDIQLDNGEIFSTSYRIPKSWTGKGQLDKFMEKLKGMGLSINDISNKTFLWKREALEGAMQGQTRHYPVKLFKQQKLPKEK